MSIVLSLLLLVSNNNMIERRETNVIIIHHSATLSGNAEIFRKNHMTDPEKMWDDIGYHFVITNGDGGADGKIELGRDIRKQGAHALKDGRNLDSIGVCLVGKNVFTKRQKITTILLVVRLCLDYDIIPSSETIQTHHEKCPGPGLDIEEIIKKVQVVLAMD